MIFSRSWIEKHPASVFTFTLYYAKGVPIYHDLSNLSNCWIEIEKFAELYCATNSEPALTVV